MEGSGHPKTALFKVNSAVAFRVTFRSHFLWIRHLLRLLGIPFWSQVVTFSSFVFKPIFWKPQKGDFPQNRARSRGLPRSPGGMCGAGLGGYRGLRILGIVMNCDLGPTRCVPPSGGPADSKRFAHSAGPAKNILGSSSHRAK